MQEQTQCKSVGLRTLNQQKCNYITKFATSFYYKYDPSKNCTVTNVTVAVTLTLIATVDFKKKKKTFCPHGIVSADILPGRLLVFLATKISYVGNILMHVLQMTEDFIECKQVPKTAHTSTVLYCTVQYFTVQYKVLLPWTKNRWRKMPDE